MAEYRIVWHRGRNQPYTVWRERENKRGEGISEVLFFCKTRREAEWYVFRDQERD